MVWHIDFNGKKSSLTIWLEKVYDYHVLYGPWYQRAMLHFQLKEEPSQAWMDEYLQ